MKNFREIQNIGKHQPENKLPPLNVLDKSQTQEAKHETTEETVNKLKETLLSGKPIHEDKEALLSDIASQILQGNKSKSIYDYLGLDQKFQRDLSPIAEAISASFNAPSELSSTEKTETREKIERKIENIQHIRYEQWIQEELDKNNTSPIPSTGSQERTHQEPDIPTNDSTELEGDIIQGMDISGNKNTIKNPHIEKGSIIIDNNTKLKGDIIQGIDVSGNRNIIEDPHIEESSITIDDNVELEKDVIQGMNVSGDGNIITGAYIGGITTRRKPR